MKKQLLVIGLIAALLLGSGILLLTQGNQGDKPSGSAGENGSPERESSGEVVMYYFWGDGCPICTEAMPFLDELESDYPELEIKKKETYGSQENARLFQDMAAAFGSQARGVPTSFIGDEEIVGYNQRLEQDFRDAVEECIEQGCIDPEDKL